MSGLTKPEVIDSLRKVADYIANSGEVEDDVKILTDKVLAEHTEQFKLFIVAYTRTRISRVVKLMNSLDIIEEKMLDETTLRDSTPTQLLRMHSAISYSLQSIVDLSMTSINMDTQSNATVAGDVFNLTQLNISNPEVLGHKDSRTKVRTALDKIMDSFKDDATDAEEVTGESPS